MVVIDTLFDGICGILPSHTLGGWVTLAIVDSDNSRHGWVAHRVDSPPILLGFRIVVARPMVNAAHSPAIGGPHDTI
jgi:hypothetical protein